MLLKFAFKDFLDDRKFKNTTKKNVRNYQTLLGEFINYCTENEVVNVEDISQGHVRDYLMFCQDKGNQAGTINTKLLRIRAFLNYMVECEVIKNNPAQITLSGTINSSTMNNSNIVGGTLTIGSGSNIFKADSNGIYLGSSYFGTAPFHVTQRGNLKANNATLTNANISGNITMTGGSISWSNVTKPSYTAAVVGAVYNNQTAVFNTLTNNGTSQVLYLSNGNLYINVFILNLD